MKTGEYRLELFDQYGYKISKNEVENFTTGLEIGAEAKDKGLCNSFRVVRCLYNSVDQRERWQAKG